MQGAITFVISDVETAQQYNLSNYVKNLAGAELENYSCEWDHPSNDMLLI